MVAIVLLCFLYTLQSYDLLSCLVAPFSLRGGEQQRSNKSNGKKVRLL